MDPGYVTGLNKDVCVILLSLQFSSDFLEHSYIKVEYIITHHQQHPYVLFTCSSCVPLSFERAVTMDNLLEVT